jgi:hypothetical protein
MALEPVTLSVLRRRTISRSRPRVHPPLTTALSLAIKVNR